MYFWLEFLIVLVLRSLKLGGGVTLKRLLAPYGLFSAEGPWFWDKTKFETEGARSKYNQFALINRPSVAGAVL